MSDPSLEMPSEVISVAFATGFGVSVLAGILSGVWYIYSQSKGSAISQRKRKSHCNVCGTNFKSLKSTTKKERVVICYDCEAKICRKKCSLKNKQGFWTCHNCYIYSSSWLDGMLKFVQPFSKTYSKNSTMDQQNYDLLQLPNKTYDNLDRVSSRGSVTSQRGRTEKEQVRDFIERVISEMLGENIDDATVARMYNDERYLPGDSPTSAHVALKQFIEKIVRDALDLPQLPRETNPTIIDESQNNTYGDLLSTAIINKVVSDSQNERPSSSASYSSRQSTSSRNFDNKEFFFGDETLENKYKNADQDTTSSVSSLEEWIQTDSSLGSTKYVDRLSLTIQQSIEEVPANESDCEDEDQGFEYSRSKNVKDEDLNWFLQKRQFPGSNSPVPVPMLVPDPSTDAKVLIGDREVDDTSDLSDAGSDYEDKSSYKGINTLLVDSKTVIGGKNVFTPNSFNLSDDEISADSGVKEGKFFELDDTDDIDGCIIDEDELKPGEDMSICSSNSNFEKDAEYTEKYGSLPRQVYKTIRREENGLSDYEIKESAEEYSEMNNNNDFENKEFTGNYSKKEKEKWKNAVEMKNNPYSKENIEKRINKTSSIVDSLFSRSLAKTLPLEEKFDTPVEDNTQDSLSPNNKPLVNQLNNAEKEYIFKAIPVITDYSDPPNDFETAEIVDEITPRLVKQIPDQDSVTDVSISEITSDSDLSLMNCYDVRTSLVYQINNKDNTTTSRDENYNLYDSIDKPVAKPRAFRNWDKSENIETKDGLDGQKESENDVSCDKELTDLNLQNDDNKTKNTKIFSSNLNKSMSFSVNDINENPFKSNDRRPKRRNSLNLSTKKCEIEPEITSLKEQKIVASRIDAFSKEFPNVSRVFEREASLVELDTSKDSNASLLVKQVETDSQLSVKDLMKKFETISIKNKAGHPIHSISGRNLVKRERDSHKEDYPKITGNVSANEDPGPLSSSGTFTEIILPEDAVIEENAI